MEIKYTRHFLHKLENLFAESNYQLRYEKGSFNSGYCLLKDHHVAIINKFYTTEGKINCLIDILKDIAIDLEGLSPASEKLLTSLLDKESKT